MEVLRKLTDEVLDTADRINDIVREDQELAKLWQEYVQVCAHVAARHHYILTFYRPT